jgi:[lysine-biosynthesis-protein LysW]---L-2-aminoadipate ligase
MKFAVVAHRRSATNSALARPYVAGVDSVLLTPRQALVALEPGDAALARLDVRAELDGVEDGLGELQTLAAGGVTVFNPPPVLLAAHDKLLTARLLRRAGIPHPRTTLLAASLPLPQLEPPLVLKPRFGSWGRDVVRCRDSIELRAALDVLSTRPWFEEHGVLAQELVTPLGHDLRIVVAAGRVVGAARREAARGEWRTNVALGGTVLSTTPPPAAIEIAIATATAAGADLVGVDLLPLRSGGWTVIELNGAVDLRPSYALSGNVYAGVVEALLAALPARLAA